MVNAFLAAVILIGALLPGCSAARSRPVEPAGLFVDEYAGSGVQFVLGHGRATLNILETLGHGAAVFDADGDGRLDLLFLGPNRVALYRNRGAAAGPWSQRFEEITARSGLSQPGYWQGVATGDVDGDGRLDLYLCGYNCAALYRNRGDGRFEDVTAASGLALTTNDPRQRVPTNDQRISSGELQASYGSKVDPRSAIRNPRPEESLVAGHSSLVHLPWNTSAAFADIDGDGWLDLYVGRYVRFGAETPQLCDTDQAGVRSVCPPKVYEPQRGVLYRNLGRGRFRDETRVRGLATAHGNALGVAFGDYDGDGWIDLVVANDELPGDLFHNRGRGHFENVGAASGTAYDAEGRVHAGMGVEFGDLDNDGRLDLAVTTFWGEIKNLYRNEGTGLFRDVAGETEFARVGRPYVGFGVRFFDADNDGDQDLVIANGHVADNADRLRRGDAYAQPTLLFRNDAGRFHDISALGGPAFTRRIVGRAACAGDLDGDGRLDLVISNVEGPPLLLRNNASTDDRPLPTDDTHHSSLITHHSQHWLQLSLAGRSPNRHAIGARVMLRTGARRQLREVTTSGSYMSAGDPLLHFGLGPAATVDEIIIRWPDGAVTRQRNVAADRRISLRQPQEPGRASGRKGTADERR